LLNFSRRGFFEPKSLSPARLVDELARLIRRTFDRSIAIVARTEHSHWSVLGDANQLHQVLMNLAINARDAMPRGGELTLEVTDVTLDADHVRTRPALAPGRYVEIAVTDTGVGMPPEIQARIFEPFFTTKAVGKGTGLGLASAYGIVQRHHGHLEVDSEVGRGTTMRVCLPAGEQAGGEVGPQPEAPVVGGSATVLIVDDEPAIRELGRALLSGLGYTVLLAADGAEALRIFRARRREIGLVVLDLNMPVLSGADTARELLRLDPDCRILIASGYAMGEQAENPAALGAVGFVQKPFRVRVLADLVREALSQSPDRRPDSPGAEDRPGSA
jgi:CheY-like chemotaxis protein